MHKDKRKTMINILLEGYDIDAPWLYTELKEYIKPHHRVAVVAFSFRDGRVKNAEDWDALYGKARGRFYHGIVDGFRAYGIAEENVTFVHYFKDTKATAKETVEHADILYFLGGLPDKTMQRLKEFDLTETCASHKGIVMGYSAGAVIQLAEYHLSPDDDYPVFGYYGGLGYLKDFYLEVHYEGTPSQTAAIQQVLAERKKPVYATAFMQGAIVVEHGHMRLLGDVKEFH